MLKQAPFGLGLLALASAALAGQAQPQFQPQPQPKPQPQPQAPAGAGDIVVRERPGVPARVLLPAVEKLFDGYVRDGKMPGIVGAFGVGDGPTLFLASGRIADGPTAPVADADSLWRVYSMTKPVTAMAAMILIEEGRIGLDDPVSRYLPAFAHMRVLTSPDTSLATRPAARPITIRNLLTHTAGLGYTIVTKGPLLQAYERQGILPGAFDARTEAQARLVRPATLQAFATRVAALPLIAEPGTRWSYSIGLDVMGAVIEQASGMPFDRFVNTRIFAPLKMASSYWSVPAAAAGRLSTNYVFVGDRRVPIDPGATSVFRQAPSFPYGGAGLVMSARDYDRFLHMLQDGGALDGVRVMRPETVRLAMSNLLPAGVVFAGMGGTGPAQGYGAGGSVALADVPGGVSRGTYGWAGAAGTLAWVDPVRHFRGTVMVNYMPPERYPLRAEVGAALNRDAARHAR